ncbi:MAG: hypothetical protein WCF10_16365 [Polyangiales bacterium]
MEVKPVKRVTIIGTQSLRAALVSDVRKLGAKGYTYTVVDGAGTRGIRPSDWSGPNGKLEVLTTPEVADRILEHVAAHYFDNYPLIAYVDEVLVLRPERYGVE